MIQKSSSIYKTMKQIIKDFAQAPPSLDSLLYMSGSLEALLNLLQNVDVQWKETFRTEWWELELTSSIMMDEERDALQNMKAI